MKALTPRRLLKSGVAAAILLLTVFTLQLYSPAQKVEAQCGSSVSSCKNCHEVQGNDPVNNKDEWHTAHAFGDFCEFCHAGNVQAKTKDEAHMGMVDPLSDVQAGCQSCHPDDYMDKAQVYATALGVEVGTGGGSSGGGGGAGTGGGESGGAGGDTVSGAALDLSQMTAPGAMVVDYNEIYHTGKTPSERNINWGNVIFIVFDLLLLAVLVGVVFYREHLLSRFQQLRQMHYEPGMNLVAAMAGGGEMTLGASTAIQQAPPELSTENAALARLLPRLEKASPVTLAALDQLLDDEKAAEDVLVALTNVDLRLVEEFKSLSQRDRELLVALAHEND